MAVNVVGARLPKASLSSRALTMPNPVPELAKGLPAPLPQPIVRSRMTSLDNFLLPKRNL
ncbi:hypothetical protein VPNG_08775 [Cytospora leucostoma]|uniref:Uncharacterized protein n=1 Tax=Cytospora leucostoma TaxID=1230097 RepID=A0A423VXM9_9PEZI|nr:hypothetical protein VPNG_08775 [Cytospora leucostoma]